MHIRRATKQDIPALLGIWNPIIRDTDLTFNSIEKTPEMLARDFKDKAENNHAFLVAEGETGVIGFATYARFRASNGYRLTGEHTINLAPHARGKGAGRLLMTAIEDHARTRGFHSMFAGISHVNEGAIAFHAALGYHEIARLPEVGFKFARWYDLILQQKLL